MKKILITLLAVAFVSALALPALAAFNGAIAENGPHWQVNFIGVPKGKTADMTNSNRRTVFVPLDKEGGLAPVKINYTWDPAGSTIFQVKDGNATDGVATIQVPSVALAQNEDGTYPSGGPYLSYKVYAVALGKPTNGGGALITAHCTYSEDLVDGECEDSLLMNSFTLPRNPGKPKVIDITNIFRASGCFDMDASGTCNTGDYAFSDMWIFNIPFLESYYWDYDANGLKHMQVRFYQTTSGVWTKQ